MSSLFMILGNEKRRKILKLVRKHEMHISGIARELGLSVPVTFKHIKKLEEANLVTRHTMGNTHVVRIQENWGEKLNSIWMLLDEPLILKTNKGTTLSDILKTIPGIDIKKTSRGEYIHAIDGKEGYFVYEINGELVDRPINACEITKNSEVEIKRLIPAYDKKIRIDVG
ncbi:MAG: winged helix-turn-helix domain-containing protein [Candidatus Altiarchaeia archaeon]